VRAVSYKMTLYVCTTTLYWVTLNVSSLCYDSFINKKNERYSSKYRDIDRQITQYKILTTWRYKLYLLCWLNYRN